MTTTQDMQSRCIECNFEARVDGCLADRCTKCCLAAKDSTCSFHQECDIPLLAWLDKRLEIESMVNDMDRIRRDGEYRMIKEPMFDYFGDTCVLFCFQDFIHCKSFNTWRKQPDYLKAGRDRYLFDTQQLSKARKTTSNIRRDQKFRKFIAATRGKSSS